MNFNSYIVSETKTAFSVPLTKEILPIKKNFKQKAFTLAETLITLSIIGVIAAMTVPTLMANVNKQIYVTGLKKAYSQLQNAMKMIPMTEGCSSGDYSCSGLEFWDTQNSVETWAKQFKVKKICLDTDNEYCSWIDKKFYMHQIGSRYGGFLTEDGMLIAIQQTGAIDSSTGIISATIGVDVNGAKGPNLLGRDVFVFGAYYKPYGNIHAGTVIPEGSNLSFNYYNNKSFYWRDDSLCTTENVKKQLEPAVHACAGRVLEEGKMNY